MTRYFNLPKTLVNILNFYMAYTFFPFNQNCIVPFPKYPWNFFYEGHPVCTKSNRGTDIKQNGITMFPKSNRRSLCRNQVGHSYMDKIIQNILSRYWETRKTFSTPHPNDLQSVSKNNQHFSYFWLIINSRNKISSVILSKCYFKKNVH